MDGDYVPLVLKVAAVHMAFKGAWHLFRCITQLDMVPPHHVVFGVNGHAQILP